MTPKNLLSLLDMALALARPSSPLQALQCVQIKDRIVTATTIDTSLQVDLTGDEIFSGIEGCVDARRFSLALGTLDQTSALTMKQKDSMLTLRCAGSTRSLKLLPVSEFPHPAWGEGEELRVEDPATLTYAIGAVRHAAAVGNLRPAYTGMSAAAGALFTTDGFRAARVKGAAESCGISDGIILPLGVLDTLHTLASAASKEGGQPLFAMSVQSPGVAARAYSVRHHIWRLQFQLVGAAPPPIDRVMSAPNPQLSFAVQRDPLRASARNIARMAAGGKTPPHSLLTLRPGDGDGIASLRIELVSKDLSSAEEVSDRLTCSWTGTQEWQCGVNPSYLADALDVLDGNEVHITQADLIKRTPLLLSGSDERLVCLISPLTI